MYVCHQSALCDSLTTSFQSLWSGVPALISDGLDIMESGEVDGPTIDAPPQSQMFYN
jgi:hypothetical protein